MAQKNDDGKRLNSIISVVIFFSIIYHGKSFTHNQLQQSRHFPTFLFMSTSSPTKTKVVFQKVVRPSQKQSPSLFISQLVEYLQQKFRLPSNLPMLYEEVKIPSDLNGVISWNSPLSTSAHDTRLTVEIIGINVDDDSEKKSPQMAMVVVHKNIVEATPHISVVTSNLFANSEKKILRTLDRGLDQFSAGKISGFKADGLTTASAWQLVTRQEIGDEYDDTFKEDTNHQKSPPNHAVSETQEFAIEAAKKVAKQIERRRNKTHETKQNIPQKEKPVNECDDVAEASIDSTASTDEDYTIKAAKNISKKKENREKTGREVEGMHPNRSEEKNRCNVKMAARPKLSGPTWTISSPKARKAKLSKKKIKESKDSKDSIPLKDGLDVAGNWESSHGIIETDDSKSDLIIDTDIVTDRDEKTVSSPSPRDKYAFDSERKLNLKVVDEMDLNMTSDALYASETEEKLDCPSEVRKTKEAQRIMTEISEESEDMTSEELLKAVLKFGEEKKRGRSSGKWIC